MSETKLMISPHADGARELLDKIRALRAEIPRFSPVTVAESSRLNGRAGVPDRFMESASVAVQGSPRLEQAAGVDATTLRDSYGFAIAYDAVVQELFGLARAVASSIRAQRAEAAMSALDVYAIAQRLSRQKDGAELIPYVDDMRKKLNKNRSRKTNSNPAPSTDPDSAPPRKV